MGEGRGGVWLRKLPEKCTINLGKQKLKDGSRGGGQKGVGICVRGEGKEENRGRGEIHTKGTGGLVKVLFIGKEVQS